MAPPRPPAPIPPASCPFVSKRPPENPENRLVLSKRRSVCPTDRLSCCPASARRQLLDKPTGPGLLLSTGVCKTKKGQKKRACVNHSPALFFRRLKNEKKLSCARISYQGLVTKKGYKCYRIFKFSGLFFRTWAKKSWRSWAHSSSKICPTILGWWRKSSSKRLRIDPQAPKPASLAP